jgi:hypothetical protein
MESEADSTGFSIDHYEPKSARPDLESEYTNLMYACVPCNTYKGARSPSPGERAAGYHFLRVDEESPLDHFELKGRNLEPLTKVGEYTLLAVGLNRAGLRRLRELRELEAATKEEIAFGIAGLRTFPIDLLGKETRGRGFAAIRNIIKDLEAFLAKQDEALRQRARSRLDVDGEDDEEYHKRRKLRLKEFKEKNNIK